MKVDILGKKEDLRRMQQAVNLFQRAGEINKIKLEINMTHNFSAFAGHSFNASKTPIIFINGQIEFTGIDLDLKVIQKKIIQLRDKGSELF